MKLYHFTAAHMLEGCIRDGLTLGGVPLMGPNGELLRIFPNIQWLTKNPSWGQTWNTMRVVQYSRTAHRITVKIPRSSREQLQQWKDACESFGPWTKYMLNHCYDFENWYVYLGRIPPGWFRQIASNPLQRSHHSPTGSAA